MPWQLGTGPRSPSKLVTARAGSPASQPRALVTAPCRSISWFLLSSPSEAAALALSFFFTWLLLVGVPPCEQSL